MKPITFRHGKAIPNETRIDRMHSVVYLLAGGSESIEWKNVPHGDRLREQLKRRNAKCEPGDLESCDLPNKSATHAVLVFVPKDQSVFQNLSLARRVAKLSLTTDPGTLSIVSFVPPSDGAPLCEAIASALLARGAELPSYKSSHTAAVKLRSIHLFGLDRRIDTQRLLAEAAGNELARRLTMDPANKLTPAMYRKAIAGLAKQQGWRMRFLDTAALKRKRAGAFLAVVQGSATRDAGIVQLLRQSVTKPHSERPKCSGSRRSAQAMVCPLGKRCNAEPGHLGRLPSGGRLGGHPRCCDGLT